MLAFSCLSLSVLLVVAGSRPSAAQESNDEILASVFWEAARDVLVGQTVNECGITLMHQYEFVCSHYENLVAVGAGGDENLAIEELFTKSNDNGRPSGVSTATKRSERRHLHDACCVNRCTMLELMRHCVKPEAVQHFLAQRVAQQSQPS